MEVLRAEKSTEDEWRYSSPTFVCGQTLIRVVNYYVSEDGSYHVSKGDKVMTRLITAATEEAVFNGEGAQIFWPPCKTACTTQTPTSWDWRTLAQWWTPRATIPSLHSRPRKSIRLKAKRHGSSTWDVERG